MSTSVFTINDIKDALKRNKWSSGVTWDLNETTNYEVFDYSDMTSSHKSTLKSASKVINSKVLNGNNDEVMKWNTALFTNSGNSNMSSIFARSSTITEWNSDLSSLTNGYGMFFGTNLTSFDSDLSSLTNGYEMFYCAKLTSFNSDLSSLTDAYRMFAYTALESFNSDLSSLTDGNVMFAGSVLLTSFESDLSSLTNGNGMFHNTALTSFDSDLSSLTNGTNMFNMCKLNTASVKNIADTINTVSNGYIDIDIANTSPNTEEETAFNTIASKGWTVYVNGRGWTPTNHISATNLTEEEQSTTPIPFYAKPIQVTEENASYVDSNNNYYNIVGGQFIYGDDISTYAQFTSFEHAVEEISLSLGLTKYVKPTEEEE